MSGFDSERLRQALSELPRARRYWIAFSGGCDSTVLLHAMAGLALPDCELRAVHVDHRLHSRSGAWAEHCHTVAEALNIPLYEVLVDVARQGDSLEAAARAARYRAFAGVLAPGDMLLLAHHRDDQAETVLLRLLRGSGPAGLAGMPAWRRLGQGWLGRPLLAFGRDELRAYAERAGLQWIEDPANADTAFDRNFLRREILPRLRERWPALTTSLSRAAELQREAAGLLQAQAAADWEGLAASDPARLPVAPLLRLPAARQRQLLRYWIGHLNGLPLPDRRHLQRILDEVVAAAADAMPRVDWSGARVRRYAGELWLDDGRTLPLPVTPLAWDLEAPLSLGDGRRLIARPVRGNGLRADLRGRVDVTIEFRRGGEWLRPAGRAGHRHRLKKLMQEWRIPPWERARLPLVFVDGEIAAVPGYCVCAPFAADGGKPGLHISVERETIGNTPDA